MFIYFLIRDNNNILRARMAIIQFTIAALLSLLTADAAASSDLSLKMRELLIASNFTGPASVWEGNASVRVGEVQLGVMDYMAQLPVLHNTRYPVASNTKLHVTISLYQLQERGIVNLSHSIADYLTQEDFVAFGLPNMTQYCPITASSNRTCQVVTFTQLLAMSACLPDTNLQFMPYPGSIGLYVGWVIQLPLVCIPGTSYYYSNPSFMLGAYFVEKFSGLSFEAYLKQNIYDTLGMTNTYFDPYNGKFSLDPLRTREYYQYIDPVTMQTLSMGTCSSEFDLGSASGAGGIVSDQGDEAILYFSLFNFTNRGKSLFKDPESLLSIVRPRTLINSEQNLYYAQGLFVNAESPSEVIPEVIQYEGEIICSHTMNYFYAKREPQLMIQLWSAVQVAYVNSTQLFSAMHAREGNFFSVFGSWPHRTSLGSLALSISEMV
jgi:CubicO group peptidase (beta-lactamase class C family)